MPFSVTSTVAAGSQLYTETLHPCEHPRAHEKALADIAARYEDWICFRVCEMHALFPEESYT